VGCGLLERALYRAELIAELQNRELPFSSDEIENCMILLGLVAAYLANLERLRALSSGGRRTFGVALVGVAVYYLVGCMLIGGLSIAIHA